MTHLISATILLALGCGGSSPPPAAAPPGEKEPQETASFEPVKPDCAAAAMYGLKMVSAPEHQKNHPAFGIAWAAADEGQAAYDAKDGKVAGRHYLDCARAFRDVPDDHPQRATAAENAESCYKNAHAAFGSANAFESEGRALFEAARKDDPRMASVLDQLIGTDPDCP